MPLNPQAVLAHHFPVGEVALTARDCMLYALSLGLGRDPLDAQELPYVYEEGLQVFPTMPLVLLHPGPWTSDPAMQIDRRKLVHGFQCLQLLAPLSPSSRLRGHTRVIELVDKGESGAVIVWERELTDTASGRVVARTQSGTFCRADGGFGGQRKLSHDFRACPERAPDSTMDMPTQAAQALLYRLNGDMNPLHASPAYAQKAGFAQPILHGLCTFGIAAHALLKRSSFAHGLASIEARFSRPVLPGQRVRVAFWDVEGGVSFQARLPETDALVLDRGFATYH